MSSKTPALKAPFPAFGGKSRIAATVWPRLSTADDPARNYIEPFCFSAAMLLLRPDEPKIETVNDLNAFVANFWRSMQKDPEATAAHADWPVNETDLHARHAWLVRSDEATERLERVRSDPEFYDPKIAGWWCWGACMWIGSGWCEERGANSGAVPRVIGGQNGYGWVLHPGNEDEKRPQLCNGSTTHGQGVHKEARLAEHEKWPRLAAFGTERQAGEPGLGVHAELQAQRGVLSQQIPELQGSAGRPQLADAYSRGRGVHGNDELTDCQRRRLWLTEWFTRLADRLRSVRVCCGHWSRVCDSDSTLTRLGTTAVFLDPPYRKTLADGTANRASHIYANDKAQDINALVDEVQAWCLKWGGNPEIRIAVCGLEGEYPALEAADWEVLAWKSQGGYGNRNRDNENAARERIWFSPYCVRARDEHPLFANLGA